LCCVLYKQTRFTPIDRHGAQRSAMYSQAAMWEDCPPSYALCTKKESSSNAVPLSKQHTYKHSHQIQWTSNLICNLHNAVGPPPNPTETTGKNTDVSLGGSPHMSCISVTNVHAPIVPVTSANEPRANPQLHFNPGSAQTTTCSILVLLTSRPH